MKVKDIAIPEELNWADYCDALADEVLLESQAKRMLAKAAPRAQDRPSVVAALERRLPEQRTPGAQ
jgi:ferritin-like metal-binding protein YciE